MQNNLFNEQFSLSFIKEQLKPLCYHNGKTVRSYQQFFRLYYYIRLLKYSSQKQLRSLEFSGVSKVATKDVLDELVKIGHISFADGNGRVFIANETTDRIIRSVSYNEENFFKVFANLPIGTETSNDIKNTDVFVQALQLNNYYFLLFPNFDYLRPDALLVLKEDNRYKLTFLEIETEQSNWEHRLSRMRENYIKLSTDVVVYEYWKKTVGLVNLTVPDINDFKFSVTVIGNINKNFGRGFEFRKQL
jgi:hypothetical protein